MQVFVPLAAPAQVDSTKTLREPTREPVENVIAHLGDWAERIAMPCSAN